MYENILLPFFLICIVTLMYCGREIRKYKNPSIVHKEYKKIIWEEMIMNTEDKILKQLEELNKKQQLTNELLLAQYHVLQEHIFRQNSPVALLSEEVDDYFTENILKDSTNKKLDEEIGGLFKDTPECSRCGYRRFMIPYELAEGRTTWTCRHCGEDTTVEEDFKEYFNRRQQRRKEATRK